jgi:hypothetical protein
MSMPEASAVPAGAVSPAPAGAAAARVATALSVAAGPHRRVPLPACPAAHAGRAALAGPATRARPASRQPGAVTRHG